MTNFSSVSLPLGHRRPLPLPGRATMALRMDTGSIIRTVGARHYCAVPKTTKAPQARRTRSFSRPVVHIFVPSRQRSLRGRKGPSCASCWRSHRGMRSLPGKTICAACEGRREICRSSWPSCQRSLRGRKGPSCASCQRSHRGMRSLAGKTIARHVRGRRENCRSSCPSCWRSLRGQRGLRDLRVGEAFVVASPEPRVPSPEPRIPGLSGSSRTAPR